jgi:hypothetical protein
LRFSFGIAILGHTGWIVLELGCRGRKRRADFKQVMTTTVNCFAQIMICGGNWLVYKVQKSVSHLSLAGADAASTSEEPRYCSSCGLAQSKNIHLRTCISPALSVPVCIWGLWAKASYFVISAYSSGLIFKSCSLK